MPSRRTRGERRAADSARLRSLEQSRSGSREQLALALEIAEGAHDYAATAIVASGRPELIEDVIRLAHN